MVGEIEMKTKLSHVGAGAWAGLGNTSLCEQNCIDMKDCTLTYNDQNSIF